MNNVFKPKKQANESPFLNEDWRVLFHNRDLYDFARLPQQTFDCFAGEFARRTESGNLCISRDLEVSEAQEPKLLRIPVDWASYRAALAEKSMQSPTYRVWSEPLAFGFLLGEDESICGGESAFMSSVFDCLGSRELFVAKSLREFGVEGEREAPDSWAFFHRLAGLEANR